MISYFAPVIMFAPCWHQGANYSIKKNVEWPLCLEDIRPAIGVINNSRLFCSLTKIWNSLNCIIDHLRFGKYHLTKQDIVLLQHIDLPVHFKTHVAQHRIWNSKCIEAQMQPKATYGNMYMWITTPDCSPLQCNE